MFCTVCCPTLIVVVGSGQRRVCFHPILRAQKHKLILGFNLFLPGYKLQWQVDQEDFLIPTTSKLGSFLGSERLFIAVGHPTWKPCSLKYSCPIPVRREANGLGLLSPHRSDFSIESDRKGTRVFFRDPATRFPCLFLPPVSAKSSQASTVRTECVQNTIPVVKTSSESCLDPIWVTLASHLSSQLLQVSHL